MNHLYYLLIGTTIVMAGCATSKKVGTPTYSPKPSSESSQKSSSSYSSKSSLESSGRSSTSTETVYERNQKDIEHIEKVTGHRMTHAEYEQFKLDHPAAYEQIRWERNHGFDK